MKLKLTFSEPLLGTKSGDPEVYRNYLLDKATKDIPSDEREALEGAIAATPLEELERKTTLFSADENGNPFMWDYMIKGFFKEAQGAFNRVKTADCPEMKAFRKIISALIFVFPRKIPIVLNGQEKTTYLERPLRGQTAQGERISLVRSQMAPAGSEIELEITCLEPKLENYIYRYMDYGKYYGLGQWRNASFGRFTWQEL